MNESQSTENVNVCCKNNSQSKSIMFALAIFLFGLLTSKIFFNTNSTTSTNLPSSETPVRNELAQCMKDKTDFINNSAKLCRASDTSSYELIDACGPDSCLFDGPEAVEGFTKIKGYYTTFSKEGWSGEQVTCEGFSVLNNDNPLVKDFIDLYNGGNRLNSMDADNNLLIRIDLTGQPTDHVSLLKSSSISKPVEISVVRHTPEPRSAGDCESVVTILGVETGL